MKFRLGEAPVEIDIGHLDSQTPPPSQGRTQTLAKTWEGLKQEFKDQKIGFYDSPVSESLSQLQACISEAQSLRDSFKDVLFLGIGGSALGPLSVLNALSHLRLNQVRCHFLENPDPIDWRERLGALDPESTLVCVITKSGGTLETLAQFRLALDWLTQKRWSSQILAITDPEKGFLRGWARENDVRTLEIAPSIGGRFSVFTPVGLFPIELGGLSGEKFLAGAKSVRAFFEKTPAAKNPVFAIAEKLIDSFPQRGTHVLMPYSTKLRLIGQWWVQLWGESLGKDRKGFNPIAAVGATDQHSLLQLLRDGPEDKVTCFISIRDVGDPVAIPRDGSPSGTPFELLGGHSLQGLLEVERRSTERVLANQKQPFWTVHLDRLNEESVGALSFFFSTLTAFTGRYWGLNPFDQPGVEEGKVYIRESLQTGGQTQ